MSSRHRALLDDADMVCEGIRLFAALAYADAMLVEWTVIVRVVPRAGELTTLSAAVPAALWQLPRHDVAAHIASHRAVLTTGGTAG